MTVNDILKRAKQTKRRKTVWTWYELYKNDLRQMDLTPEQYQDAISQLRAALKI